MWFFNKKELKTEDIPANSIGFIYKITNEIDGMWYIGRKLLTRAATKTINGKKKKIRKESDWAEYWSSSPKLIETVEKEGKLNFKREILLFVSTKAALTYSEEYFLHVTGALFDPKCYNGNIRSRIQRSWFAKTPNLQSELEKITP